MRSSKSHMFWVGTLVLVIASLLTPQQIFGAELGVGLGRNVYKKADVNSLGYPWVFNWAVGDTTSNGNNPQVDFPGQYIPMLYGCSSSERTNLKNWITTNNYNSYVLILNEPDRADQANCPAATAATAFKDMVDWKNASSTRAGIKYIVGGTLDFPAGWLSSFISAYVSMYGANPQLDGIHFHIYPSQFGTNVETNVNSMNSNINTWITWLNQPAQDWLDNKEAWITEYGVLYPGGWGGMTIATTDQIFQQVTSHIQTQPRINRAAWYVFSYLDWEDRSLTALAYNLNAQQNGAVTSKHAVYKNLCLNQGQCALIPPRNLNGGCASTTGLSVSWSDPNISPYQVEVTLKDVTNPNSPITLSTQLSSSTGTSFTALNHTLPGHTYLAEARTKLTTSSGAVKYSAYKTKQIACSAIAVKDTSVTNNLITNDNLDTLGCGYGKWCRWARNSGSYTSISSNGKLSISSGATVGDYGSCWLQWIANPQNGSQYRLRGNYSVSTPFPNNAAFMQIEIIGNANTLSPPVYLNGTTGSFDRTFTYSSPNNFMSVKFCSWGTYLGTSSEQVLTNLSLIKL